ncbi:putative oxidoreductase YdgJ [Aquisphaera giovannonii]|uniref:Putative oxidoreductase YdgJ n=1 Tax=Aquisphaera giovannonii TaxID=406548 RepID=A0A5B9WB88_9BACT|nr:Gfo/Idh/MocA family oxidoreductase [Aquisphaera giovannonii]QEH37856.1 putative oxidoreductase YdgJ [Aquisphaera giovannonii]
MSSKLKVAVIGAGYWGPNLIRNFSACPLTEVAAICDANPQRLEAIARNYGHIRGVASLDELLEMPLDAVAIATPVSTHFPIASRCLEAGLHVLVEKPLAGTVKESQALVELASARERILMVDHTYLFNNAVRRVKALIDDGELGDLYYVDSIRINLGLFQRDINVIWDLAPHDLSIVDYILGGDARSISAWGCGHAEQDVEDMAYVNVDYGDRLMANFHVNWLSPVKIRQMIFAGSRKSLVFNELNSTEPIKVYDRGIELGEGTAERSRLLVGYRTGDVWSPYIDPGEALQAVVSHFATCIRDGERPVSDGELGLRVVRMLEAASRSIKAQGGRVVLGGGVMGSGANGYGDARAERSGQRDQGRAGRPAGTRRDHALLR